jgi:hypothetical protein
MKLILAGCLLLLVSCGSDVTIAGTRGAPAGDAQTSATQIAPEDLGPTLQAFSRRLEGRIDRAATDVEKAEPRNEIRRYTLRLRIRTAEFVGESLGRANAVVSMVELWYLTVSMSAYYQTGNGKAIFAGHQSIVVDAVNKLREEAEGIVKRVLSPEHFIALKQEITDAVGRGELFAAAQIEKSNILADLLSVSHLQTILSIPLAPFDALNGVSKGSDALHQLADIGSRAVELAARYPRLLSWYVEMMAVEIQEQDAAKNALSDLHELQLTVKDLGQTAKDLGQTVKDLPMRLRVEANALLDQSKDAQKTTQGTLERAQATADALDRAARSLDGLVKSVDLFIASFRPPPGSPPPAAPAQPGHPFDIRDYTTALQATEASAREIKDAVDALNNVTSAPELQKRLKIVLGETDTSVEKVNGNLRDLVDHITVRVAQVVVLLAVVWALVLLLHRLTHPRRPAASPSSAPSGPPSPPPA